MKIFSPYRIILVTNKTGIKVWKCQLLSKNMFKFVNFLTENHSAWTMSCRDSFSYCRGKKIILLLTFPQLWILCKDIWSSSYIFYVFLVVKMCHKTYLSACMKSHRFHQFLLGCFLCSKTPLVQSKSFMLHKNWTFRWYIYSLGSVCRLEI